MIDDAIKLVRLVTTLMVYIMSSDGDELKPEEKSRLMTFLGKFVTSHEINERGMQVIVRDSVKQAKTQPFPAFLKSLDLASLRRGQRLAIYANVYDAMLIDAVTTDGEVTQMEQLRRALHIESEAAKPLHYALSIKNDPEILTNFLHPLNELTSDHDEPAAESESSD